MCIIIYLLISNNKKIPSDLTKMTPVKGIRLFHFNNSTKVSHRNFPPQNCLKSKWTEETKDSLLHCMKVLTCESNLGHYLLVSSLRAALTLHFNLRGPSKKSFVRSEKSFSCISIRIEHQHLGMPNSNLGIHYRASPEHFSTVFEGTCHQVVNSLPSLRAHCSDFILYTGSL